MKHISIAITLLFALTCFYQCGPLPPTKEKGAHTEAAGPSDANGEHKVDTKDSATTGESAVERSPEERAAEEGTTKERGKEEQDACSNGLTKPCYGGPQGTQGVGECKAGVQTCQPDGTWGQCQGEVAPLHDDSCNGKDENCDGNIDESYADAGKECDVSGTSGICKKGHLTCTSGRVTCKQVMQPKLETCDGTDEDCNGSIDDIAELGKECKDSGKLGVCQMGSITCTAGKLSCQSTTQPGVEICNGKDDDCDGNIDNNTTDVGKACQVSGQMGPCAASLSLCKAGTIECPQTVTAKAEICNGKDDDCDGNIDNNPTDAGKTCQVSGQMGPCAASLSLCKAGTIECPQTVTAKAEVCNGIDDDCDGNIDNNPTDAGRVCQVSGQKGLCAASLSLCKAGTIECPQTVTAKAEVCNNRDDDCDGILDDGCPSRVSLLSTNTRTTFVGDENPNNGSTGVVDQCPPGQAITGVIITASSSTSFITSIQFYCYNIAMSPQHHRTPVTYLIHRGLNSSPLPVRGTRGSYSRSIVCPGDTFLYGFTGRSGSLIDEITGYCAPLNASTSSPYTIARGAAQMTASSGGTGGGPFGLVSCPAPMIANGAFTRTSHSLFGLSLICSTPTMELIK